MIFTKFCPDIDLIGLRSTTCDFQPAYSPPEKEICSEWLFMGQNNLNKETFRYNI